MIDRDRERPRGGGWRELWLELGDQDRAAVYFRSMWRDRAAADRLSELLALEPPARSSVAER